MQKTNNQLFEKYDEIIDCKKNTSGSAEILVPANTFRIISITNISFIKTLNIVLEESSFLEINCIFDDNEANINILGTIKKDSEIIFNTVDFSKHSVVIKSLISLIGEEAKGTWNASCLSQNKSIKKYNISFDHNVNATYSHMNNYGVVTTGSTLFFDGCSAIKKQSIKSEAYQIAKIIIYDENCRAKADPVLKIDNEDIVANHGAAVGTLNGDHMFYLLSRGINEKEARNLITYGYLKPVFSYFLPNEQDILVKTLGEII